MKKIISLRRPSAKRLLPSVGNPPPIMPLDCRNIIIVPSPGAVSILTLAVNSHLHSARAQDPWQRNSLSPLQSPRPNARERCQGRQARGLVCSPGAGPPAFSRPPAYLLTLYAWPLGGQPSLCPSCSGWFGPQTSGGSELQEDGVSLQTGTQGVWIVAFQPKPSKVKGDTPGTHIHG